MLRSLSTINPNTCKAMGLVHHSIHILSLLLLWSSLVRAFQFAPTPTRLPCTRYTGSYPVNSLVSRPFIRNVSLWASSDISSSIPIQLPSDDTNVQNLSQSSGVQASAELDKVKTVPFLLILWRFTRPHTILGSALAIPALHALAAPTLQQALSLPTLASCLYTMIPSLLMNLYITGLNQITDVEIDRINKPTLPIASGELSRSRAIVIVTISLLLSLTLGIIHPIYSTAGFNLALWGSFILGTLYSLPPFRLKRFPLMAALCIVAVRGTIINSGFFAHAKSAVFTIHHAQSIHPTGSFLSYFWDTKCILSSLYFAIFGTVIALMKDVPDATGDAVFKIRTFSVRIGQKAMFNLSRRMLTSLLLAVGLGFGYAATTANTSTLGLFRSIVALFSVSAFWIMRKEAAKVNPEDSSMVYNYYMGLWKVFYLSYLVLPFAR